VVFAYDYPILGVFWTMFMFFAFFMVVWVIIWCFIDNFRRRDHHGFAKFVWTIVILFIPVLGALIYILARPRDADSQLAYENAPPA
jgi:hypothetical protein